MDHIIGILTGLNHYPLETEAEGDRWEVRKCEFNENQLSLVLTSPDQSQVTGGLLPLSAADIRNDAFKMCMQPLPDYSQPPFQRRDRPYTNRRRDAMEEGC